MRPAGANEEADVRTRLASLERTNQILENELRQLRIYKDYAYTDVLTEIPNRRFFLERLVQEMARSRRAHHPLGLALVDLDHFKQINDQIGHRAGDQVLKFFSQFLKVNLRAEDILCRIGGDEFAVILPDTDARGAAICLDRVKAKFDRIDLSLDQSDDFTLSFSCGIAAFLHDYTPEDLIDRADQALYTAKESGRSQVVAGTLAPAPASQFVN